MPSTNALVPNDADAASTMAALCRNLDWSATPLGDSEQWPTSLRTAATITLTSPFPMLLLWGDERTQIYNDGYCRLLGPKHPEALGSTAINTPLYDRVRAGESVVV